MALAGLKVVGPVSIVNVSFVFVPAHSPHGKRDNAMVAGSTSPDEVEGSGPS